MGMGQYPIGKLKWDFLRTSITAFIIDKNMFSAPFGIFLYENGNFRKEILKNILCNPPMGCFTFANSHFQMGVTVMGFAEDFGH